MRSIETHFLSYKPTHIAGRNSERWKLGTGPIFPQAYFQSDNKPKSKAGTQLDARSSGKVGPVPSFPLHCVARVES